MNKEKVNSEEKIWTDCGYFQLYKEAENKIEDLGTEFELYKIRRVKEKSKEGWYKVKAWKKPTAKNIKNKKKK